MPPRSSSTCPPPLAGCRRAPQDRQQQQQQQGQADKWKMAEFSADLVPVRFSRFTTVLTYFAFHPSAAPIPGPFFLLYCCLTLCAFGLNTTPTSLIKNHACIRRLINSRSPNLVHPFPIFCAQPNSLEPPEKSFPFYLRSAPSFLPPPPPPPSTHHLSPSANTLFAATTQHRRLFVCCT